MKIRLLLVLFALVIFTNTSLAQTWNGSISTDWNNPSNWTPAAVPLVGDNVLINDAAAPNQPILPGDITLTDLRLLAGSLDLAGFTLTLSDDWISTGGTVTNGNLVAVDIQNIQNTTFNGPVSITKIGNNNDDWNGGNTFNGPTVITNNSNRRIRLANTAGDTFNSTVIFNNIGTNFIDIAYSGTNTFQQSITINNSSAAGDIRFGENGGTSLLQTGGILTTGFSSGALLEFNNFTQVQAVANGSFSVTDFTCETCILQGDFSVNTSDDILLSGDNTFAGNNIFNSSDRLAMTGSNIFSTNVGATSEFTTGGTNDDWFGGNTFGGPTTITNNANNRLRLASNLGDTFNSTVTFQNNGNNFIDIARTGTNTFGQSITINNSNAAGDIRFGESGGTSVLTTGAVLTTGFTTGALLEFNSFTQVQSDPNGSFQMDDFRAINSTFEGDFVVTTNDDLFFQGGANFNGSNTFTASDAITMTGGNSFSINPGTSTTMIKNGASNNNWEGGNTFGDFTYISNGDGRTRMANSAGGDTFLGDLTLRENGTGEIEPARNGTNTFAGDISTIGSGNALSFALGNGVVSFIGNSSQSIRGDGATTLLFEDITMNTTGDLTLEVPITIADQNGGIELNLNSGIINTTSTNIITMLDETDASAGSVGSHVNGPMVKLGEDTFTFPVGDAGFYAPLTLANGGNNADSYTAEYLYIAPVDIPTDTSSRDATIGLMNRNEHWELQRNSGTANRTITLSYDASRTDPLIDYTELLSTYWDGSSWIDLGGAASGDNSSGTIPAGTTTNSGFLTIASSFRILPIELLSFKGKALEKKKILIEWRTASERNNAFFTLEKSLDGNNWKTIAIIEGAGDSDAQLAYSYIDTDPRIGRQFYRLTQTDFDGNFEIFQVVGVNLDQVTTEDVDFLLYPNPASDLVKIRAQNINLDEVELSILDVQGKEVMRVNRMSNTFHEMKLTGLSRGMYLFRFMSLRGVITKKVIVN